MLSYAMKGRFNSMGVSAMGPVFRFRHLLAYHFRHVVIDGHRKRVPLDTSHWAQSTSGSRQLEAYLSGRRTTAHPYAAPVPGAFDAIRNSSHCWRDTSDYDCKAWREAREAVAALTQESRRLATGGFTATIYQFSFGSVAYFAPDASYRLRKATHQLWIQVHCGVFGDAQARL